MKEGSSEFGGAQSVKEMSGEEIGRGEEKLRLSDLCGSTCCNLVCQCARGGDSGEKKVVYLIKRLIIPPISPAWLKVSLPSQRGFWPNDPPAVARVSGFHPARDSVLLTRMFFSMGLYCCSHLTGSEEQQEMAGHCPVHSRSSCLFATSHPWPPYAP